MSEVTVIHERTVFEGRIPFRVFYFSHGVLWLLLLGWNFGLLLAWLQSLSWLIRITSQRVVLTRGLLAKRGEEVEYYRVRDTSFQQSAVQRMFGVGTVTLMSDDVTAPQLTFPIQGPKDIREQVRDFVRTERQRMRTVQID